MMKKLWDIRQQILSFVGSSPRTSMIALAIALAQLANFIFDLPDELLQILTVLAVALIGLFAKDEENNGKKIKDKQ